MSARPIFSKKKYNEFVHQVELQNIWLDEMHLVRPTQSESEHARLELSIAGRHEIRPDGGFDVYIKMNVNFIPYDQEQNDKSAVETDASDATQALMRVELVYGASYTSSIEGTQPMLEHFSQSSAQLALWPYLREELHSILLKAGQDGVVLPVFSPFLS